MNKFTLALASAVVLLASSSWAEAASFAAPGTQVVDRKGAIVGYIYASGNANGFERQINGDWYLVKPGLVPSGIIAILPIYSYTSKNCSGTAYAFAGSSKFTGIPGGLPPEVQASSPEATQANAAIVTTATIIYPQKPYQKLPLFSHRIGNVCSSFSQAAEGIVGIAAKEIITVVPPLKIQ
jgi:hypothetical protein